MKNKILVFSAFAALLVIGTIIGCTGTGGSLFPGGGGSKTTKKLLLVDFSNSRSLIFDLPVSTHGNASVVLGQPDFNGNTCSTTATGQCDPNDGDEDPSGNIWIADYDNSRILEYKPPFSNGMAASVVIGQADFISSTCAVGPAALCFPANVAFDSSGNLWVDDWDNSRILQFKPPFSNGMSATLVLGQTDLNSNNCAFPATASSLCDPWQGLVFDSQGNLWVSDSDNCRILRYSPPFSTGMAATLVIGQAGFTSSACGAASSTSIGAFGGMAFDKDGNLWAVDGDNNRVLEFVPPFTNGMAASKAVGQADLTSSGCGTTASTLCRPYDVSFDSDGNMYTAEFGNDRVLVFAPPFSTGMSATKVLGQADFTSTGGTTGANGLSGPEGVTPIP